MRMRQKTYPSDMSREQFEHVLPILEQARKRTKPRRVDMYEVWCAVLYLLRTGCQWRALPSDFPKWRTVHSYFAKWSECDDEGVSLLEQALKKSGWRGPRQTGAQRLQQVLDRGRAERKESPLKNPLQAPSVIGDSGTALKDGHPIARIQARKNAIQRSSQRRL